jgi:drug/metabolite transporter (DMT)-like permease
LGEKLTATNGVHSQESSTFNQRVLAFSAIYLLWGGSYLAIRFVVEVIPPFLAAGIRYSLSSMLLLAISFLVMRDKPPTRRQFLNCVGTGLIMFAFSYSAIYWAETRLSSWLVAIIASTGFLWTYLAECLILRGDAPRPRTVISLVAGAAGVALLVGFPFQRSHANSVIAALAVVASTLLWSLMTVMLKRIELPRSSVQRAGLQLGAAGFALIPFAYFVAGERQLPPISRIFGAGPVLGMLYLVIGGSTLAYTAFHWLLARESPSLVATSTYVNPIVAMLAGIALGHERYTWIQLCGALVVLLSVIVIWWTKSRSDFGNNQRREKNAANSIAVVGGALLE